jgi:regulator of sigma E protease
MGTTILLGLISIGILIFVHELGHFLAARAAGIRVEVFSIGWGKGLVSFMWKETRIQIGWIPFGGYCKMAGDSPRDERRGGADEYYSSPPQRRILVALSGPIFNYLFAALLFTAIIVIGYEIKTFSNRIILADVEGVALSGGETPAQAAGLRDGDVIVDIDGNRIRNWDDVTDHIVRNALRPIRITVRRDERLLAVTAVPDLEEETGRGLIGIHPWVEPVIGEVLPGEPADRAGLRAGDRILSVDGAAVEHHMDFYDAIEDKGWQEVSIVAEREGTVQRFTLMPEMLEESVSVGLLFEQIVYQTDRYPLPIAVGRGFAKSAEAVSDTVRGIVFVFSGKIRARSAVAGPARLIYLSGLIAREGFTYFLQVMSYISIAFFIMNLIPFPALDGSHIVIALWELVTRKRPNLAIVYRIQTFGFIVLIVALIFITMNDISSFFGK